jgi:hypothetical protein
MATAANMETFGKEQMINSRDLDADSDLQNQEQLPGRNYDPVHGEDSSRLFDDVFTDGAVQTIVT